jgi:hypothetical protein
VAWRGGYRGGDFPGQIERWRDQGKVWLWKEAKAERPDGTKKRREGEHGCLHPVCAEALALVGT